MSRVQDAQERRKIREDTAACSKRGRCTYIPVNVHEGKAIRSVIKF